MAKITNEMRYKTAEERCHTYYEYAEKNGRVRSVEDFAYWLSLEADEEKPENCPFCGDECYADDGATPRVVCINKDSCCYQGAIAKNKADAIAAHNRVARAVMAVEFANETMNKIENSTVDFCNYEKETIMGILRHYRESTRAVRAAGEGGAK